MINKNSVEVLARRVEGRLSAKRFKHSLGVKKCAELLGEKLLPDSVDELAAAALLHDISKELPIREQLKIISESDFVLTEEDARTEGVIHSFSAPEVVKRDFPEYATPSVLSAVLKHTVGAESMSVFDKIIFLSDYIEENRVFDSCSRVRDFMLGGFDLLTEREALARLNEACLMAISGAEEALLRMNQPINSRMYLTKKIFLEQKM